VDPDASIAQELCAARLGSARILLAIIANRSRLSLSSTPVHSVMKTLYAFLLLSCSIGNLSAKDQPNIIFIFTDDLGWKDVGCYGNDFIETPRIDRLAAEGVRFTDFYAAGAVCSPTRCAVQSGQNQARIGRRSWQPGGRRPLRGCRFQTRTTIRSGPPSGGACAQGSRSIVTLESASHRPRKMGRRPKRATLGLPTKRGSRTLPA
jgi:hypothetical protein